MVHAGKYRTEDKLKIQVGLFYNTREPTRGGRTDACS